MGGWRAALLYGAVAFLSGALMGATGLVAFIIATDGSYE